MTIFMNDNIGILCIIHTTFSHYNIGLGTCPGKIRIIGTIGTMRIKFKYLVHDVVKSQRLQISLHRSNMKKGIDIFKLIIKTGIKKIRIGQGPVIFQGDWVYAIAALDDSKIFLSFIGTTISFGIFDRRDESFTNITQQVFAATGLTRTTNSYPVAVRTSGNKVLFDWGDALLETS